MTVADRIVVALVLLAGIFAAWACARVGAIGAGALACAVASAVAVNQAIPWTRSRRQPPLVLECRDDGRLQVRRGGGQPVPVSIGAQTRLLGPSVYLDFSFADAMQTVRCRRWLTPFDAPAQVLRRWSVLLPQAGALAS